MPKRSLYPGQSKFRLDEDSCSKRARLVHNDRQARYLAHVGTKLDAEEKLLEEPMARLALQR
jgi:hypothetical protein